MVKDKFEEWIKTVLANLKDDYTSSDSVTDRNNFYNDFFKTAKGSNIYIIELGGYEAKRIKNFYINFIEKLENEIQKNITIFCYFDLENIRLEFERIFYQLYWDSKSYIEKEAIGNSVSSHITASSIDKIQIVYNECIGKIKSELKEISLKFSMVESENIEKDITENVFRELSDEEIELHILLEAVIQYKKASSSDSLKNNKCAREIDISKVLEKITGEKDYRINFWLNRIAPHNKPKKGPLCRCSNSTVNTNKHKYHVRVFEYSSHKDFISAWERIGEIKEKIGLSSDGIFYNSFLQEIDFKQWMNEEDIKNIGLLYIDIDDFGQLNKKYTETLVDETILPDFKKILEKVTKSHGKVYREHDRGDEFVIMFAVHNQKKAKEFAEKLYSTIESKTFIVKDGDNTNEEKITVSIGLALWPDNGKEFNEIKKAANKAKQFAKDTGKDKIVIAHPKYIN